jgi:hypothetical protein
MLFPRNALASGPQAWLGAEKGLFKVKVGNPLFPIDYGFPKEYFLAVVPPSP